MRRVALRPPAYTPTPARTRARTRTRTRTRTPGQTRTDSDKSEVQSGIKAKPGVKPTCVSRCLPGAPRRNRSSRSLLTICARVCWCVCGRMWSLHRARPGNAPGLSAVNHELSEIHLHPVADGYVQGARGGILCAHQAPGHGVCGACRQRRVRGQGCSVAVVVMIVLCTCGCASCLCFGIAGKCFVGVWLVVCGCGCSC